jgi:RNA 2',3'-cyclic 3'-phosphodiesterase
VRAAWKALADGFSQGFPMARLFAAIGLSSEARAFAGQLADTLARTGLAARFERLEKLHCTLAFLGAVPADRIPACAEALSRAAERCAPFSIAFDRLGGFPEGRHPTLLWLGCSDPQPEYDVCAKATREAFEALGSHFDNDSHPHVTLCRCKRPLTGIPDIAPVGRLVMPVKEIALWESIPERETTRYETRAVSALSARRDPHA